MDSQHDKVNTNYDMEFFSLPTLSMKEYNSIEYLETKITNDINMTTERPITLIPLDNLLSTRVKKTLNTQQTTVNQPKETFFQTLDLNTDNKTVHLNEITNELAFEHGNKYTESNHALVNRRPSDDTFHIERTLNRFKNETTSVKIAIETGSVNRDVDELCKEHGRDFESENDSKLFESPIKTEFEKSLDHAFTSTKHNISNVIGHEHSISQHDPPSQNNSRKKYEETPNKVVIRTPKVPIKKLPKTPNISANTSTKTPKIGVNTTTKTPKIAFNTSIKTPKMCANKSTQTPKKAVKIGSVGKSSKLVESSSKTDSDIKNTSSREVKNSQRTPVPTPRCMVKSSKVPEFVSSTPFKPLRSVGMIKEEPL
ncbi:hypothetical protein WDU94_006746 [Cyamophila willieti]